MNFSTKHTSNSILLLLIFCFHVQIQAQTATIQGRSSVVTSIPDNNSSGATATINISGIPPGATITDIEVQLSIFHEYAGDIGAEIRSPGGGALDELLLFNKPGSGSESSNLFRTYNLTFNDAFTNNPRTMGSTIGNTEVICRDDNICDYYPQGASPSSIDTFSELIGFINGGSGPNGDWEVKMIDHASGDSGVFTVPYVRVTFTMEDLILDGTTGDDDFHVVRDGNETVVTLNGTEISRIYSLGLNSLTINGGNGNDLLTVDYDGGDFQHPITFNGGNQNGTPGDIMQLEGTNSTYAFVNYNLNSDSNGTVSIHGNPILTYSGLKPIVDNLNSINRSFNFNGGAQTITLEPGSTLHNFIDSTLGASVDFNNPTYSLTIQSGYGNDRINIEGVHANFDANLTITGGDDYDEVYAQLLPTDLGNGDIDIINIEEVIIEENLTTGGNIFIETDLQTQIQNNAILESTGGNITINTGIDPGTGIDFTGFLCSNSTVRTANGDISITAKGKSNGTSNNPGISISNNATVTTTGTGAINLNGTGGNGISRNYGVSISTSTVSAPGGGDITITGNSGTTAGEYNHGVRILEGNITVTSGNLSMNGVSQNTGNAGFNLGLWLQGPSDIKSTGSGNMTFNGTGGTGTSGSNLGIIVFNDIQIFNDTSTGFIQMTGTGGTNGDDNDGIIIQDENTLISTNGGGVTLTGNGGNSTVGGSHSGITMVSGTVRDQGTGVVQLHGTGGNSERENHGLLIAKITGNTSITANGGGIIMTGNAGINSTGIFSGGIAIIGAAIRENATGNIQLNGTGGIATGYANGIIISSNGNNPSIIANGGGNITLTGTGGTASTLSFSDGIIMDSGTIRTYSGGNIVLDGTSGTAAGSLTTGVYYDGTDALINANGNLTISGSCTDATGVGNAGVLLLNPAINASQGDINITGSSTDPAITAVNHMTNDESNGAAGNFSITGIIGKIKTPAGQAGGFMYTATNTSFTGILAPGQSPGEILIGGNLTLNAATTLEIEVNNFTTAGTDYDHINTGFIDVLDLGGATLNLIDNTTAVATGTEVLTLIHNGDLNPITGTFNGLPHGTDIPFNGETWRILYNGGTHGNDVVLVSDLEAPVAVCQDITLNIGLGGITVTADQLDGGSTDNVGVETFLINGEASLDFTYDDLGDNEVTITVVDVNGNTAVCTANITLVSNATLPILISEYQPALSGDPTQEIEIKGEPGESFVGTFVVIEGINSNNIGVVLSADNFSGTFDANGLLTATIPDLRNPSHTAVLTSSFSGTVGVTDVDTDDDGTVDDITSFGLILDAVGITNGAVCCPVDVIYGAEFGGVDLAYIGGQAAAIFRTASVGGFYQISLSNGTIYDTTATIVDASAFSVAPTVAGTFGSLNPSFIPAIIVPQVIGELQADAETAITTAGFTVGAITTEYSLTIPAGTVLDQSPTAGNLIQPNMPIDLVISGGFNPDEFITKWQTTTDNETIVIPFDVGGSTTINWGDGTIETITGDNPSHTYATAGQYLVSATENINYIRFNNGGNKLNILEVVQWGSITWSTMESAFYGCENLQITATDAPDLSLVTSTKSMFRGAISLTSLNEDNSQWDVSNIQNMAFMFRNCYNFNQDISSWDVSNVTNFASFLYTARVFNYDLNSWDMSSATDIRSMFYLARDFNQDLSAWDISNVSTANNIFSKTNLSTANYDAILTGWSTLDTASGETAIPNAISFGAEEIYFCNAGFERQILLEVHGWTIDDAGADSGCFDPNNLTPFITKWETTTDNESITIPTTETGYLYTVDWGDGTIETAITGDATHTYATTGIHTVSITAGFFPRIYFNSGGDALKLLEVSQWGNNPWTSMQAAFKGCKNLIISATDAPNLSNATSMNSMFRDAAENNNAIDFWQDISHWDVSTITDISQLFRGMNFNQDIDIWNVSNANNMGAMFRGNVKFNQDISSWNVSNVTNMSNMFYLASDFNKDISAWDVSKVQSMLIMFRSSGFNQNLSAWDISSATNMADIFTSSQMSVENYDNTLIGWATLDATAGETQIPTGITFGANNIHYCEAEFKRQELINIYGWNITDAEKAAGCNTSFITTWETTTANETITIPTFSGETYNYLVNWGDGTTTLHSNSDATTDASHTYATAGEHTVSITGDFPRIYFNFDETGNNEKITKVVQWGNIVWKSMERAFANCINLDITATDIPDLSIATSTNRMLNACGNLVGNTTFNTWDVSNIDDMTYMFASCENFNMDLNNWNVSNVTLMTGMFTDCDIFNGNVSSWNTENVINMNSMFANCTVFTGVGGLNTWDVSEVENMGGMFRNCELFNQDLDNWTTSSVIHMGDMFGGAITFNGNISTWDVTSVEFMDTMFQGATDFNSDISQWNIASISTMIEIFENAESFNIDINTWDVSNINNMNGLFEGASSFNQSLDTWDVSNVQYVYRMFHNATDFNQDLSSWDVSNVTSGGEMLLNTSVSVDNYDRLLIAWAERPLKNNVQFDISSPYCLGADARQYIIDTFNWTFNDELLDPTCSDRFITTWETTTANETITIPTFPGETYNYSVNWGDGTIETGITADASHQYTTAGIYTVSITGDFPRINFNFDLDGDLLKIQTVEQWGTITWSSMDAAFAGCSNLTVTATDAPDLSNAITTNSMFFNCSSLLGNESFNTWDVSTIEDMSAMFSGATNFNTDLNNWNVANATNMSNMFSYATNFNGNISSWNTGEVTNMSSMFKNNTMFEGVNGIGNWDVSKVENMSNMFENAIAFNQNLSAWDISAVTTMTNMLNGVSLSTENYDNTLIGWVTLDAVNGEIQIPNGVTFSGGDSMFCTSDYERQELISSYNWTITDAGKTADCTNRRFITTWKTDVANESVTIPTEGGGYNYLVDWGDGNVDIDITGNATHMYATAGVYTVSITGDFPRIYLNQTFNTQIQTVEQWGSNQWSSMLRAFATCSSLDVVATDTPDLSNVTHMGRMFFGCSSLVGNEYFNDWDVSNVNNFGSTFTGARNFNQPLNNWDVSNAIKFTEMFSGATSFDQSLGDWDISNLLATNVTDAINMFSGVTLSTENYDATLTGWATLNTAAGETQIPMGITFNGGNSQYCLSETKRQELIDTYGWTITDGGTSCGDILLAAKVYLQGAALNPNTGEESLMRDDLRIAGIIPTRSPYTDMISCEATVFDVTGDDAIVDWVWVELRDEPIIGPPPPPGLDDKKKSALLQRDGDIVDVDGVSPLTFSEPADNFHIIVKHRNHLSIMSVNSIALSSTVTTVDFTDGSVPTYGTNAQTSFGMSSGVLAMWAGNVNGDTIVQYSGTNPDTPDILSKVLNDPGNFLNFPTFAVTGYNNYDINMDGNTQYSGTTPDTPFILQNVLAHPGNFLNFSTYQIIEQLP